MEVTAETFAKNKLGDKPYSQSAYPMYRKDIIEWLEEFASINIPAKSFIILKTDLSDHCKDEHGELKIFDTAEDARLHASFYELENVMIASIPKKES